MMAQRPETSGDAMTSDMKPARAALVTGASRGIGRATALALASRGLAVFVAADGTAAELAATVEACRAAGAPDAAHGVVDLQRPGEAERMVETARVRLGRIDVLVNNAGIRCRKPFGEFSRDDFDRVVAVNLAAAFFASQAVLPTMRAQGGGRIIHVASQLGSVGGEGVAIYGLTKAALIHLTKTMALELSRDNIQVNSVSPGPIATEFNRDVWAQDPAFRDVLHSRLPGGRAGTPEDVAEAIAFLATSEGTYIQGHDLVIDGGYIIH
jgi:NAD(P)-dependent dehydrogenase (short-subunit alcohol dehydrogenase family)